MPMYTAKQSPYDAVVIGAGPAGLTAALYLARAKCRVLVLERLNPGGQIALTHRVDNYPGAWQTSGPALAETMHRQAKSFGAEFMTAEATALEIDGDPKVVHTTQGAICCSGILLATGAQPRKAGFRGEDTYTGRGVSYCASCDGHFFTGKDVFVIGGGYAAAEESVFLTKFARHVTILIRKDDFSCAASVAEKARSHEKISVLTNTILEEVSGENRLQYVRCRNTQTASMTEYRTEGDDFFGVFVLAGRAPDATLLRDTFPLDAHGYVVTDSFQSTGIPGVYAAGDICSKPLRQLVTAASDGAVAAASMAQYLHRSADREQ